MMPPLDFAWRLIVFSIVKSTVFLDAGVYDLDTRNLQFLSKLSALDVRGSGVLDSRRTGPSIVVVVYTEEQRTQFLNTGHVQIEVVLFRSSKESQHQPDHVNVLDIKLRSSFTMSHLVLVLTVHFVKTLTLVTGCHILSLY